MKITGIILAGGSASRFQSTGSDWKDKLTIEIEGTPIIKRVHQVLSEVVDEVIISTKNPKRGKLYLELIDQDSVDTKFVVDDRGSCSGPLLGIASSSNHATHETVLVVPGDTPFLKPTSLKKLLSNLGGNSIVVPVWFDGMVENLIFAGKKEYVKEMSNFLCALGYWGPSGLHRGSPSTLFVDVAKIFEEPKELININYQVDLEELKPRKQFREGFDVKIENESRELPKNYDHYVLKKFADEVINPLLSGVIYGFLSTRLDREFALKSAKSFDFEVRRYKELMLLGLMVLAYLDAARYLELSGYNFLSKQYRGEAEKINEFLHNKLKRLLLL